MLREEIGSELVSQVGALLTRRAFARFKQRVDYAESGGALLLGLNGVAVIGHGRSSAHAVENGIATAARLVEKRVVPRLTDALARTR
jgi:glycerol-3-phosphate acyltransferase PlsX